MSLRAPSVKTLSLVLTLLASPAAAQTVLPTTEEDWTLRFQVEKPFLVRGDDLAPMSSVIDTDLVLRWSSNVFFQIGIPLAVAQQEFVEGTSFYFGNLRGNFLFGEPGDLRAFLGVTLPTASNISGPRLALLILGLPALDEEEAWESDVFSVRGGLLPGWDVGENARVGVRLGGAFTVPTDFETGWIFARPGAWGRFLVGSTELRADVSASSFLNGEGGLADRTRAYLDLGAALPSAWGYPELLVRLPLDGESRSALDVSVGLALRL